MQKQAIFDYIAETSIIEPSDKLFDLIIRYREQIRTSPDSSKDLLIIDAIKNEFNLVNSKAKNGVKLLNELLDNTEGGKSV